MRCTVEFGKPEARKTCGEKGDVGPDVPRCERKRSWLDVLLFGCNFISDAI